MWCRGSGLILDCIDFLSLHSFLLRSLFCLQLTDGRKPVGGKLEVKIRIRDPFKSKQVEEVKEKWLVIDQFLKTMVTSSIKVSPW